MKASNAQLSGRLKRRNCIGRNSSKKKESIIFNEDEFIKSNTTLEILSKLRTVFKKQGGSVTGKCLWTQ